MKYKTFPDLLAAYANGELGDENVLWLDNDNVSVFKDGKCVFRDHPQELLASALFYLKVPTEYA